MNDSLFDQYIFLVDKIVNKMNYGYLDRDDLYQAGLIGLYKATKKYNEKINNNFISFSSIYIISEIKNELRNNKLIVLNKNIIKVKKYLKNNTETSSIIQIAKELNVSVDTVYHALNFKEDIYFLDKNEDDENTINDIPDNNIIDQYIFDIELLDELSKKILLMKYYKNYSQSEIAKLLKCSQSKISRIENKALEIIKMKNK